MKLPRLWKRRGDWLDAMAEQFTRAGAAPAAAAPGGKRVVLFSLVPWNHGVVEHLLASSLRARGCWVRTVLCGGGLPACGMESSRQPRPACEDCLASARRYADAFRLDREESSALLAPEDFERARRFVEALADGELQTAEYKGVAVGKACLRDLSQYFHSPVLEPAGPALEAMRRFLAASVLNVELVERVLARHRPDVCVVSNGKSVAYSAVYDTLRARGIEVVTWDLSPAFRNGFTFNRGTYAPEVHLEGPWERARSEPLTPAQEALVDGYFGAWRSGKNARFDYHRGTAEDSDESRRIARAASGKKLLSFFSNLTWETSHLGRNIGFAHLLDAVSYLIGSAASRPGWHVVIRSHPAEVKVPDGLKTAVPLAESIAIRHPRLPENVTVLAAGSQVNSYWLSDLSDLTCVYTSTVGLEAALRGRRAVVLGDCHYRGKGFTTDIGSPGELAACLDAYDGSPGIAPEARALAKRYAYLWVFRHVVRLPYLDEASREAYTLDSLEDLRPGSGSVLDRLCDRLLSGAEFLDVSANGAGTR